MRRQQLVEAVGRALGDEELADDAVTAFADVIVATVASGQPVTIKGLGTFRRRARPANRTVPATYVPRFDADRAWQTGGHPRT